jgi:hypothetical protein
MIDVCVVSTGANPCWPLIRAVPSGRAIAGVTHSAGVTQLVECLLPKQSVMMVHKIALIELLTSLTRRHSCRFTTHFAVRTHVRRCSRRGGFRCWRYGGYWGG